MAARIGLVSLASPESALMRHEVESLRPPYFPKTISCPPLITGESKQSGRNSGLDDQAEKTTNPNEFRESQTSSPGFLIRAGIGRFHDRKASCQPLLRRKVVEQYPTFWRGYLQSGSDSRRVARFRAQFGLRCRGETCGFVSILRTISRAV